MQARPVPKPKPKPAFDKRMQAALYYARKRRKARYAAQNP